MKNFLIAAVLLLLAAGAKSQVGTISGILKGNANSSVKEIQMYYNARTQNIKIDEEKRTFSAELDVKTPQFVEVKVANATVGSFYAIPGEAVQITIDRPFVAIANMSIGQGNTKLVNEALDVFYETFEGKGINTKGRNWVNEIFGKREIVIDAIGNTNKYLGENESHFSSLAPKFKADFDILSNALLFLVDADDFSLAEIKNALKWVSTSEIDRTAITIPFFRQFLTDLTNAYAARKLELYKLEPDRVKQGSVSQTIAAEALVKYVANNAVKDFLLYDLISRELTANGLKNKTYVDFLFENASESVTKNFIERYETLLERLTNNNQQRVNAEPFNFVDATGKVYTLDDFKGKMLYIDFWATWCGPCKSQLPHFKDLATHYKGQEIVFVKVSLDTNKEAWLKSLEENNENILELHANGAFRNPFVQKYGISAIPRFMLIDSRGRVISENMPRPQEKAETTAIIDADLFKTAIGNIISQNEEAIGAKRLISGNAFQVTVKQSMMGIDNEIQTIFQHPGKLKIVTTPMFNEMMRQNFGDDFFNPRYLIINNDLVSGNLRDIKNASKDWAMRVLGFELFLLGQNPGREFEFAIENANNTDNQYVLQTLYNGNIVKFFIDRDDFLVRKIITSIKSSPRQGGGNLEVTQTFSEFTTVDGVTIPFKYSTNNMLNFTVTEAKVGPVESSVFREE